MDEWVRKGECNHCGWCCENVGYGQLFIPLGANYEGLDEQYTQIRGFGESTSRGHTGHMVPVDFRTVCPLFCDQRCSINATKPRTCSEYPLWPGQIVKTPCSYWFARGEEKVGGEGSPHPWPGTSDEFNKKELGGVPGVDPT